MEATRHISPKRGDVILMVGTTKGAFLLNANRDRQRWRISDPHIAGESVYSLAYDGRQGRHRIWSGSQGYFFGTLLRFSDDFGRTWSNPESAPIKFPEDTGQSLKQIWQITMGPDQEPDKMYCGVEPAALFESNDAGHSWALVRGLFNHPHRERWMPGAGGLCLHTVIPDPVNTQRVHIAVSAAGVYRTDDGGKTWTVKNKGLRADFQPEKYPEFGQCVHKVSSHPSQPNRLFLQNHGGIYRSNDAGDTWQEIIQGVPSDFGFPIVVNPNDANTAYVVPLEQAMRCGPDAKLRVYRTRDGGASWKPLTKGLPQQNAYETVLRDGLAADSLYPAGIYFGTRSGKIFGSRDDGNSWQLIMQGLPPVVCVKAAVVTTVDGGSRGTRAAAKARSKASKARTGKPKTKKAASKARRRR